MTPQINMAIRAATRAGQIIVRSFDRIDTLTVEQKRKNDLVSEVDRNAERAIVDILHKAYPEHGIMGEESGVLIKDSGAGTWIIDPLDGTTNFLHGIPHFCVSIAFRRKGQLEHGVIVDPIRNEEFIASRGQGARVNGKRMRVTNSHHLDTAVLATGIPPRSIERDLDAWTGMVRDFTASSRAIRRAGSAALDLAYVAAGRFDGFWEPGLSPWDIAAGALMVIESGGLVSDLGGGDDWLTSGNILAASPRIHRAMRTTIAAHLTPALANNEPL